MFMYECICEYLVRATPTPTDVFNHVASLQHCTTTHCLDDELSLLTAVPTHSLVTRHDPFVVATTLTLFGGALAATWLKSAFK